MHKINLLSNDLHACKTTQQQNGNSNQAKTFVPRFSCNLLANLRTLQDTQYTRHTMTCRVPPRQPLCPFITSTCLSTTTITNRSGTLAKFPVQIRYLSPLLIVNHEETCLKYSNIAILLHPGNSFALQSSSTIYFLVDTTNQ